MAQQNKTIDERSAIINTIVSNFYRTINRGGDGDTKQLLLLIAALSVLNSDIQTGQATSAAKRLAQLAMSRGIKRK